MGIASPMRISNSAAVRVRTPARSYELAHQPGLELPNGVPGPRILPYENRPGVPRLASHPAPAAGTAATIPRTVTSGSGLSNAGSSSCRERSVENSGAGDGGGVRVLRGGISSAMRWEKGAAALLSHTQDPTPQIHFALAEKWSKRWGTPPRATGTVL